MIDASTRSKGGIVRAGPFALIAAVAALTAVPVAGQVADRTSQGRDRGSNAVVVRPGATDRAGADRGRAAGSVVVVTPYASDRDRRDARCRDDRGRRDGRHGWFDVDGRYDCEYDDRDGRYDRDRRPVGVAVRASLAREHVAVMAQLDREHDRWHRNHGWQSRNRGWQKSHEALHRRLERDHERWHRRSGAPFVFSQDLVRHDDVPGRARGVVVVR
jgi:hypothetical protein